MVWKGDTSSKLLSAAVGNQVNGSCATTYNTERQDNIWIRGSASRTQEDKATRRRNMVTRVGLLWPK